ncbi:hypothetical protein PAEPH01_0291 [Pancytospora epiphaga]|nr:hypothetical protein PAEPH01_0291 [Pancytospora epiphaga]
MYWWEVNMIPTGKRSLAESVRFEYAARKKAKTILRANSRLFCQERAVRNARRIEKIQQSKKTEEELEEMKMEEICHLPMEEYLFRLFEIPPAEPVFGNKKKPKDSKRRSSFDSMFDQHK